jgi:hypothetical protein
MSLIEASYFYNDFSELFAEVNAVELSENVKATDTHEEILTCFGTQSDL